MAIKEIFKNYKEAKKAVDQIEFEENTNGATAETEAAWSEAYEKEFEAWKILKEEIKRLTACTDDTAKRMIATRLDDIEALIMRLA